jgi:hypothetical protein
VLPAAPPATRMRRRVASAVGDRRGQACCMRWVRPCRHVW